jgi:hypothetical protein
MRIELTLFTILQLVFGAAFFGAGIVLIFNSTTQIPQWMIVMFIGLLLLKDAMVMFMSAIGANVEESEQQIDGVPTHD